jgi:hypothetical protein
MTGCAKQKATEAFISARDELATLENSLQAKLEQGKNMIEEITAEDVLDAQTIEWLKTVCDNTSSEGKADIPEMAVDLAAIEKQTGNLNNEIKRLQAAYDELDQAINAVRDSQQVLVDKISAEKEAKLNEAVSAKSTHSVVLTDSDGNKQKVTLAIGSWIKSTETELLKRAWNNVGGNGDMPLAAGSYSAGPYSGSAQFIGDNAAFAFGTVTVENLTLDFPASNFGNGNSQVNLSLQIPFNGLFSNFRDPEYEGFGISVQARQYSDGSGGTKIEKNTMYGNPLVRPKMESNKWGPTPFAVGVDKVFTPNHPEGNPKFDEIWFFLSGEGDDKFQIGRTW